MNDQAGGAVARIEAAAAQLRGAIEDVLAATKDTEPRDREATALVLEVLLALGTSTQAGHGLMLQTTARADRLKAAPGGIGPWLAAHLDFSSSRARQHAQEARTIGTLPHLTQQLAAGAFGPDTTRALTRTAKAVVHTSLDPAEELQTTIAVARAEGVSAANLHVRVLEHTLDPHTTQDAQARQRARSFLRFSDVGDGFTRIDGLLDAVRATSVRAAIDLLAGSWYRTARLDKAAQVPEDVASSEQYNAQALTRLAEVFLTLPPARRKAVFSTPILFYAPQPTDATTPAETTTPAQPAMPDPTSATSATGECRVQNATQAGTHAMSNSTAALGGTGGSRSRNRNRNRMQNPTAAEARARSNSTTHPATDPTRDTHPAGAGGQRLPSGCAVSAYGDLVALSEVGPMSNTAGHLLLTDARGRPVILDGKPIDADPLARLATPAQRIALGFRDRHCTFPGCRRPALWPLEAHHLVPYSTGGATTLANLALACGEHHDTLHHPHTR